jgi:hypothetical protein
MLKSPTDLYQGLGLPKSGVQELGYGTEEDPQAEGGEDLRQRGALRILRISPCA